MSGKFNIDDYVDVAERIGLFYEKYPRGSLRCKEWSIVEANGQTFFVYVAQAFRDIDDPAPAEGIAWEPVPGNTQYTKLSEAMVCETSAWGRAIAALGFEVKRGIASRQEVQNRRSNGGSGAAAGGSSPDVTDGRESVPSAVPSAAAKPMSEPQSRSIDGRLKTAGVDVETRNTVMAWATDVLTGGRDGTASAAIDGLKENTDNTVGRLILAAQQWAKSQSDVPGDETDLPTLDGEYAEEQMAVGEAEDSIPF